MSVKIRMQRGGNRNRADYRIVVADSRSARDGRFIEAIGTYDPLPKEKTITFKDDRYNYWLSKGAQASDSVAALYKVFSKRNKGEE
jgi:small subunit ribosomal protein S16